MRYRQLRAGKKLKGRGTMVPGRRCGIGTADLGGLGLAGAARGGDAEVAPLCAVALCCIMVGVRAVDGGRQM